MSTRSTLILGMLLALLLCALPRPAAAGCPEILAFLADKAVGATCFHADDLRVPNPPTAPVTPANNSITTFADGTPLPGPTAFGSAFSFTPVTDLGVISNGPAPTSAAVPGIQVEGWFAHDPSGEARFLLRFPDTWNGKLVVAELPEPVANSMATGLGATTSCRRDTRMLRRTRACSTCTSPRWLRRPSQRPIHSPAG